MAYPKKLTEAEKAAIKAEKKEAGKESAAAKKETAKNDVTTKQFDNLLSSLQEKFGEGSIMKLGEVKKVNVAVISTGSFSLDSALGVGGLPRGRVVEIFGPESSGKCINRNSMIFSEHGMLPIDHFGRLVVPGFQKNETYVYAENCFEKTGHFYNNGLKRTIKIQTHYGFTIEGTQNHRIRIIDTSGNYLWRRLDEITDSDHVAIQRGQHYFGKGADLSKFEYQANEHDQSSKPFAAPTTVTRELAVLMGYLVGDGTTTKTGLNKNNIQFTSGDNETARDFSAICEAVFQEKPRVTPDKRTETTARLVVHSVRARAFLEYAGLGWHAAGDKEIPWTVLSAPQEIVAAFLSSLFESDGCYSGATIEYCTKSERLASQLHIVLLNFGIVSKTKVRTVQGEAYHYLYIDGQQDKAIFLKEIGFRSSRKNMLLKVDIEKEKMPQTNVDVIPNINNLLEAFFVKFNETARKTNRADWKMFYDYLPTPRGQGVRISYDRLSRILDRFEAGRNLPEYQYFEKLRELHFFYDKIENISVSSAHVVDFTVPKGATFFANGFVNHNTTLALNVVAQAQKQGGKAAFIDAEHAMDPTYAAKLGVDINELLISQPDSGEEALNILDSLVRSGLISVVVVDSVAALTPRAELEGEMGEQHVGRQARMMGQALRKLTAIANNSNTLIIFINQIRMKIGIMFGNPETTPGGRALPFAASVRIDIRRIAQVKKGENVVGNRVKAKVVKNKVAAPFKFAEFDILFGEGISYEGDVLNAAVAHGVVKKSGSSFMFEGERIGVGMENSRAKLKEDKKLLGEIKKKTTEAIESGDGSGAGGSAGAGEKAGGKAEEE